MVDYRVFSLAKAERGVVLLRIDGEMPTNNNGCADVIFPHHTYGTDGTPGIANALW